MDLVKELYNNGKLYRLSLDPSGIDISGENQIFHINSDKIVGNLNINGDTVFNGDCSMNNDFSMNGNIFHTGDLSMNGHADMTGDISLNDTIDIDGDISINGNIDITGEIDFASKTAIKIPNGNDSERPTTSLLGQIRYNNNSDQFEGYRKISELLSHWEQFILPAGAIQQFAMQTAPNGWIPCDGRSISINDYPKLYAAISTTYGGSGVNFNVPDFRGRFIRGWDKIGGTSANRDSGRNFGTSQDDENKQHNHSASSGNQSANHSRGANAAREYNCNRVWSSNCSSGNIQGARNSNWNTGGNSTNHNHGITIGNSGDESRPKNIAILICIKY